MWKVVDNIVGEVISCKNYDTAYEEAERRVVIHEQEFPYRHRGMHYAIPCAIIEDKPNQTITINAKRD